MSNRFTKQPSEEYPIFINFANALPRGANIAQVTAVATNIDTGSDITSAVLDNSMLAIVGQKVKVKVKGGIDSLRAKITVRVTLDDDLTHPSILEEDVTMLVIEI